MRSLAIAAAALVLAPAARAGSAECWIDEGAVVVAASFGDIAGDFILDASAPRSALHVTRAQEDGIEAGSARRTLVLAGERIANVDMAVADLNARTAGFATSINGVIGADVLRRFVVEIDFSPCSITLYRRRPPPMAGAIRLAARELGGVATVRASISDGVASRAGAFAIDTGVPASRISQARLSRTAAGAVDTPIRLRALAIGGRLFEQIPAALAMATDPSPRDSIGTAVWRHWRLRLDMRGGWLDLAEPRLSPTDPPVPNRNGPTGLSPGPD